MGICASKFHSAYLTVSLINMWIMTLSQNRNKNSGHIMMCNNAAWCDFFCCFISFITGTERLSMKQLLPILSALFWTINWPCWANTVISHNTHLDEFKIYIFQFCSLHFNFFSWNLLTLKVSLFCKFPMY